MKFGRVRSDELFFSRYRGTVVAYAWYSVAFLSIVFLAEIAFWALKSDHVWLVGWQTFWRIPEQRRYGIFLIAVFSTIPWVTVPGVFYLLRRTAAGYLKDPRTDPIKRTVLWLENMLVVVITVILAPALTVWLLRLGLEDRLLFFMGGSIPAVSLIKFAWTHFKRWQQTKPGYPHIVSFGDKFRPLNSRVINLDVGALAPRLTLVAKALAIWSKFVDGSAPTAKIYWDTIVGIEPIPPSAWSRNLRRLACTNINNFRHTVADVVQTDPGKIVFLPSTTRALYLVLETLSEYDAIITTSFEHPSEEFLFRSQIAKRGLPETAIERLEILPLLDETDFRQRVINGLVGLASRHSRPVCVVSEVAYCFGVRFPVSELAITLREKCPAAQLVIDGAHAVGQFDVNLSNRHFDYYFFSGHKWLYGPASLGVLVLGRRVSENSAVLTRLRQEAYESLSFADAKLNEEGSTISLDPFIGLAEVLGRLQSQQRTRAYKNIVDFRTLFELLTQERRNFCVLRYNGLQDDDLAHGIINVQRKPNHIGFESIVRIRNYLEKEKYIVTKAIEKPSSLRLCLPFYLSELEVERVVAALEDSFGQRGF